MLKVLEGDVIHDIIEGGVGKGEGNLSGCKSTNEVQTAIRNKIMRSERVFPLRLRDNAYPIFDRSEGRMRFRYMRKWIESGYRRAGEDMGVLGKAMDEVDKALGNGVTRRLKRGEMVWTNNHVIAHARAAFDGGHRKMVRVWLECDME